MYSGESFIVIERSEWQREIHRYFAKLLQKPSTMSSTLPCVCARSASKVVISSVASSALYCLGIYGENDLIVSSSQLPVSQSASIFSLVPRYTQVRLPTESRDDWTDKGQNNASCTSDQDYSLSTTPKPNIALRVRSQHYAAICLSIPTSSPASFSLTFSSFGIHYRSPVL